jgi:cytochrome o ubiquinol oxidase subunit 3
MNNNMIQTAEHISSDPKTIFGFWLYLMTDCVLFGSLFATYAVLHHNTFGGPSAHDIFDLRFVLIETMVLLTSSFTCGIGMLLAHDQRKKSAIVAFFASTFLLGALFLGMELTDFSSLIHEGAGFTRSAFLSSFYTLVGTHGLHVAVGLLWLLLLIVRILRSGITHHTLRKLLLFSLFWHFLDVVWIFIFTIVYLLGTVA